MNESVTEIKLKNFFKNFCVCKAKIVRVMYKHTERGNQEKIE